MDRNSTYVARLPRAQVSLSARRAWIEILCLRLMFWPFLVALRKESVDRNVFLTLTVRNVPMSLSARRAWIEMLTSIVYHTYTWSLSARRAWIEMTFPGFGVEIDGGRSPQGERG